MIEGSKEAKWFTAGGLTYRRGSIPGVELKTLDVLITLTAPGTIRIQSDYALETSTEGLTIPLGYSFFSGTYRNEGVDENRFVLSERGFEVKNDGVDVPLSFEGAENTPEGAGGWIFGRSRSSVLSVPLGEAGPHTLSVSYSCNVAGGFTKWDDDSRVRDDLAFEFWLDPGGAWQTENTRVRVRLVWETNENLPPRVISPYDFVFDGNACVWEWGPGTKPFRPDYPDGFIRFSYCHFEYGLDGFGTVAPKKGIKLRDKPSFRSKSIGEVKAGAVVYTYRDDACRAVEISHRDERWVKVKSLDNKEGYAYAYRWEKEGKAVDVSFFR